MLDSKEEELRSGKFEGWMKKTIEGKNMAILLDKIHKRYYVLDLD